MYSISKLGAKYGLSRTALLYYESIGLLEASGRTNSGYRVYSENDAERLSQIMLFREMGIPLEEIKSLLTQTATMVTSALFKQLQEINYQIHQLRDRQDRIIKFLPKINILYQYITSKNPAHLQAILAQVGINQSTAWQWHANFEKASPEEHQKFLKAIGFTGEEIRELIELVKNHPDYPLNRFFAANPEAGVNGAKI